MRNYSFVLSNFKGRKLRYIMAIVMVVITAFLNLLPAVIIGDIVDFVIYNKDTVGRVDKLWYYTAWLVGVTLVVSTMRMVNRLNIRECAEYVGCGIRERLYEKLQTMDVAFYAHNTSGELISQMTTDINVIREFLAGHIYMLVSDLSSLIFTFAILLTKSITVSFFLLAFVPFIALFAVILHSKTKMLHKSLRDKFSDMNGYVNENLGAYRVVKAFAREEYEIRRLNEESTAYRDMAVGNAKKRLKYATPIHVCAELMRVLVLIACGILIIAVPDSGVTVGSLMVFNSLIFTIVGRVRTFSVSVSQIQQFNVSVQKVTSLYNTTPDIDNVQNIESTKGRIYKIEFRDVTLILDNQMILDHVSFTVREGETLAIMGPTGAGKTILISMLLRLYDPSCGQILINNVDIKKMDLNTLRKMIALSTQDVFLFSETIGENIAYSNPDIPIEEIRYSAECAQAANFIEKLSEGYDTIIGERGVGLSGGQRQRIALARAVAKKSSLIILDDTTSAVDMETESMILQELGKIKNKIKIIVAQRITSVVDADKILVIENGKITEMGTHEELVNAGGYYTSIYNISQQGSAEVMTDGKE